VTDVQTLIALNKFYEVETDWFGPEDLEADYCIRMRAALEAALASIAPSSETAFPMDAEPVAPDDYEYITRRKEWSVDIIQVDQYGTEQSIVSRKPFPTRELAEHFRSAEHRQHPYVSERWIPRNRGSEYEEVIVRYREVPVAAPLPAKDAVGQAVNVLYGPRINLCWTQDSRTPEQQIPVVLITKAELDRVNALLAASSPPKQSSTRTKHPHDCGCNGCCKDAQAVAKEGGE
jgi:hypothetical protein